MADREILATLGHWLERERCEHQTAYFGSYCLAGLASQTHNGSL